MCLFWMTQRAHLVVPPCPSSRLQDGHPPGCQPDIHSWDTNQRCRDTLTYPMLPAHNVECFGKRRCVEGRDQRNDSNDLVASTSKSVGEVERKQNRIS